MITQLYSKYFHKSSTFLYPLLGFKKDKDYRPAMTYVQWQDIFLPKDRKLICLYRIENSDKWRAFEKMRLLTHPMLDFCQKVSDELIVYVFDMNSIKVDFDCFLNGKYSRFSNEAKQKISRYYGIHTPEWVHIESFLFPEKYHQIYADLLDVKLSVLQENHELCSPYNPEKETYGRSATKPKEEVSTDHVTADNERSES